MSTTRALDDGDGDLDPLLVEAVDWVVRLSSGTVSTADATELAQWRATSPAHDAMFRELAMQRQAVRALDKAARTRRRDVLLGVGGLVVAGGAYGLLRPPLGLWPSFFELNADYRTGTGERYAFTPVPGVDVEMNSQTSMSRAHQDRGVRLIRGEAFVTVRDRPAPFLIDLGTIRARTRGAQFNIRSLADAVGLVCTRGAVSCEAGGAPAIVRAGESYAIDAAGRATLGKADPAVASAWLQGLLVFDGTPLSEVIDQINLYRPGKVILADASAAGRPVEGVFHTAQIENALGQIQQLLDLPVRHLPGGVVLLG